MSKLEKMLKNSSTGWLFGLDWPSALDAHLVVFIARMQNIDRHDLIPEKLKAYGERAMKGPEWSDVMQGRATLPRIA